MTTLKRIFIVGHTGAGKSSLGQALAEILGWQYIDANPGLERYIGRNLHEILGAQGEAAFHHCEAEIIAHYLNREHIVMVMEESVIATAQNRKLLASEYVLYLKVSTQMQMQRWENGRIPLLPIPDLKAFLDQQHTQRDKFFEEIATFTLEPDFSIEADVSKVMKTIEQY